MLLPLALSVSGSPFGRCTAVDGAVVAFDVLVVVVVGGVVAVVGVGGAL